MAKKTYVEPSEYFPKDIRKEFKIGEYNDDTEEKKKKDKETRDLNQAFRDYVNDR